MMPLSRRERLFVMLRWCEELSLAEIAAVLELEIAQVGAIERDILERARAHLARKQCGRVARIAK